MCQNLDLRLLLFYCLFMLVFSFYLLFFPLMCFNFLLPFPTFSFWIFCCPSISPLFHLCFWLLWVSSLAYPNLLGTKWFGCCCCCSLLLHWYFGLFCCCWEQQKQQFLLLDMPVFVALLNLFCVCYTFLGPIVLLCMVSLACCLFFVMSIWPL
jgi:hypothetical protein